MESHKEKLMAKVNGWLEDIEKKKTADTAGLGGIGRTFC